MKFRYVLITVLIGVGVLLAGCSSNYAYTYSPSESPISTQPTSTTTTVATTPELTVEPTMTITPTFTKTNEPYQIKTVADLQSVKQDLVYPSDLQLSGGAGINYDVFTKNDNTPVFGHHIGDKLSIQIYNAHDKDCVYSIVYTDISEPAYYSVTGITYSPAPETANKWLKITGMVAVKSHELLVVPLMLTIPGDVVMPEHWEFRLTVINEDYKSQIVIYPQVRVLFSTVK